MSETQPMEDLAKRPELTMITERLKATELQTVTASHTATLRAHYFNQ